MVVLKKTHKGWEKDVKRIRPFFNKISTGYIIPSTIVSVGSRGYRCENENSSLCNAYCCGLNVEINPLEIAIISSQKKIPPSYFIDYCEDGISICRIGDSYVDPLFAFKKKSGESKRCLFNQDDFKCGIYDMRPIVCRAMPYFLDNVLKQKKTCAGYKCGARLSQEEFSHVYSLAKTAKIFSSTYFKVDYDSWKNKNHGGILESTFKQLGMPFYEVVVDPDLGSICENMKKISNFENNLRKNKTTQDELLEIISEEIVNKNMTHPIEMHEDLGEVVTIDEEAQC